MPTLQNGEYNENCWHLDRVTQLNDFKNPKRKQDKGLIHPPSMSDNDDTSAYGQQQQPEGQMNFDHDAMMYGGGNFLAEPVDYQPYDYESQFENVQLDPHNGEAMDYEHYEPEPALEMAPEAHEYGQAASTEVEPVMHVEHVEPQSEEPSVPLSSSTEPSKPKGASKRKTDPNGKSYCETLVDKSMATPEQLKAIECIGTERGMIQMNNWLTAASQENDVKRLCNLLAQCYHAEVTVALLSAGETPKTVRQLRKFGNKDVQRAANEVYKKWLVVVQHDVKKTSANKTAAPAKPHVPKGVSVATNPLDLLDAEDEPAPAPPPVKRPSLKARPKTARTKQTKFRLTGFEEDADDQAAPVTMPVKTLVQKPGSVSSRPATNALPATHAPAVVSDAFANALAASAGPAPPAKVVRKTQATIRPSAPPIIPAPSMAVPSSSSDSSLNTSSDKNNHGINGPDPSRVPQPGQRRRIHFADDKELPLTAIKFIPCREDANNHMHSQKDMQHADAEQERRSMAHLKHAHLDEEEDEDAAGFGGYDAPEPMEPPMMPVQQKQKRYIYISKVVTRKTDHVLYHEEEERKQQTLAFFAPAGTTRDMVSTPEKHTPYAYTNDFDDMIQLFCTSKKLPVEVDDEMPPPPKEEIPEPSVKVVDEPMEVLESPASPPKKDPVEPQIAIIEDFDIHSAHAPKPKGPSVAILTPDLRNILKKLQTAKTTTAPTSVIGAPPVQVQPQIPPAMIPTMPTMVSRPPPPVSSDINIVEVPIDIHSGGPSVVPPMQMGMLSGPRPPFRAPGFGGGFRPRAPVVPCRFFAQGRCTKGPHCPFPHSVPPQPAAAPPPMRNPPSRTYEPNDDDYHRGNRDYHRRGGRDPRDDRSPPPRRPRRSPSPLRELREQRRRRRSDSRSPDRGNSRRRRRSPSFDRHRERSRSRSPIPSRSPSPRYD
uniref:C3H1-type domain-containing protein n=1 Tax=Panagrellus redivivus TaxID=6233 RepID=A0A7E4V338_PANRE